MTVYTPKDLASLLASFFDPDGDTVTIKAVNGVDVSWTALGSNPYVVTLPHGTWKIWKNPLIPGNEPTYDDGGVPAGHPQSGASANNGGCTITITDGKHVVGPINMHMLLTGKPDTGTPSQLTKLTDPVISGASQVGQVLTCVASTWSAAGAVTVTRTWTRDNVPIPGSIDLSGPSSLTYTIVAGDTGKRIRCQDKAVYGTTTLYAVSNDIPATPVTLANTVKPSFSGVPIEGRTLSRIPGTWVGTGTVNVTPQWLRDGAAIPLAINDNYIMQPGDVGHVITLRENATDSFGSLSADSLTSITVQPNATINEFTIAADIADEFASHPDKGWKGFTSESGFTIVTATSPDQVKTLMQSWAAGTPGTSLLKIILDWDGLKSSSTTSWGMVTAAKLTAYQQAGAFYGYNIPPGGVWLEAAPGKTAIFDTKVELVGMTRLHIGRGVRFAGALNGNQPDSWYCLKIWRNSTYPLIGCVHVDDGNFGQMDNRPGFTASDMSSGIQILEGYSFHANKLRVAGVTHGACLRVQYIDIDLFDVQGHLGDAGFQRGYTTAYAGRTVYTRVKNYVGRDMYRLTTTGTHCDGWQLGTNGNNGVGKDNHAAYKYHFQNVICHFAPNPANPGGTQGIYLDDAPSPIKFEGVVERIIFGLSAYWGHAMWDPSQAGHTILKDFMLLRAGNTQLDSKGVPNSETYPRVTIAHGVANGGSRRLINGTLYDITGGNAAAAQLTNVRYCSPRKGVPAGRDGLTAGTAKRIEEVIKATISRDGSDFMTYTVPGSDSTDAATAAWAMVAAFEPKAGWGTPGVPPDPASWPGFLAHP